MDKRTTNNLENAINNLNASRNDDVSKAITRDYFPQIKEKADYVENMCERVEEICSDFLAGLCEFEIRG